MPKDKADLHATIDIPNKLAVVSSDSNHTLRPRTLDDLNQVLVRKYRVWSKTMLQAANFIDDYYSRSTTHRYSLGDCLLAKHNLLARNRRIRKNPGMR